MCWGGFGTFQGFQDWWAQITGVGGIDLLSLTIGYCGATGAVPTSNPPYALNDFLSVYPKFFGPAASANATLASPPSTTVVVDVLPANLAAGQFVTGAGIPNGTLVVRFTQGDASQSPPVPTTITLSQVPTSGGLINIYTAPVMPLIVLQLYINLALTSVMQAKWQDAWYLAMGLFVAHYCTMYLRSESGPNLTAAQIASSGLEKGITVSKAAGNVSAGIQLLDGFDEFGSLRETTYGMQFATLARGTGAGAILV